MSALLFLALPGNQSMAERLAALAGGDIGILESRNFPDGETYLRLPPDLAGRSVVLVCTLAHPNGKFLPLVFAAGAARELGASRVGLVAPYLCYMRQDARFKPGEAVTSRHFASLISHHFDWLVTLDPHLHRYKSLGEIYSIPARAVHAAPALAKWIRDHVQDPFLVGPDEESAQWVSDVARASGADYCVLMKQRLGDRDVKVTSEGLKPLGAKTPVLVDDVISSGKTVQQAIKAIAPFSRRPPVVLAVHGVFSDGADTALERAGAQLVTTNAVVHPSNRIDIAELLALPVSDLGNPGGRPTT